MPNVCVNNVYNKVINIYKDIWIILGLSQWKFQIKIRKKKDNNNKILNFICYNVGDITISAMERRAEFNLSNSNT